MVSFRHDPAYDKGSAAIFGCAWVGDCGMSVSANGACVKGYGRRLWRFGIKVDLVLGIARLLVLQELNSDAANHDSECPLQEHTGE